MTMPDLQQYPWNHNLIKEDTVFYPTRTMCIFLWFLNSFLIGPKQEMRKSLSQKDRKWKYENSKKQKYLYLT